MPRCVACDCYLTDTELMMDGPDGNFEDMCFGCRGIAYNPNSVDHKHYQFQELTDFAAIVLDIKTNSDLDDDFY